MAGPSELRLAYISAAEKWIETIRAEMGLATPDHSMVAMGRDTFAGAGRAECNV